MQTISWVDEKDSIETFVYTKIEDEICFEKKKIIINITKNDTSWRGS